MIRIHPFHGPAALLLAALPVPASEAPPGPRAGDPEAAVRALDILLASGQVDQAALLVRRGIPFEEHALNALADLTTRHAGTLSRMPSYPFTCYLELPQARRDDMLHAAVWAGRCEGLVRLLLDHGASARSLDPETGLGCLTAAILANGPGEEDNARVIPLLLAAGADPCERDPAGGTPLLAAVTTGQAPWVIRALLAHGADPSQRDREGRAPLDCLDRDRNPEIARLLERPRACCACDRPR